MIPPRHTPNAVLSFRARLYRSRHPTLRTVRIAGNGNVWVDGTRRECYVASVTNPARAIVTVTNRTEYSTIPLSMYAITNMADALEVVR